MTTELYATLIIKDPKGRTLAEVLNGSEFVMLVGTRTETLARDYARGIVKRGGEVRIVRIEVPE